MHEVAEPLISVISPVYNEERFVNSMIDSLIDQTHQNWELLVVDDGSSDETAAIIKDRASYDSRIRLVSSGKRLGKVRAFNAAFAATTGALICHVGGDDLLPPESLSLRASMLSSAPPRAVLLGKLQMIDEEGRNLSAPLPRGQTGSQSSPGTTYSRELAEIIFPIPPQLPSEDIWLGNAAVNCQDVTILHTTETIIYYRVHSGNSNPRHKTFEVMTEAIHARSAAIELLAQSELPLRDGARFRLQRRAYLETARNRGQLFRILTQRDVPAIDRIATASMANPALWRIRQRIGTLGNGWRGR